MTILYHIYELKPTFNMEIVSHYDIIKIVKEKEKTTMRRNTHDTIFIVISLCNQRLIVK